MGRLRLTKAEAQKQCAMWRKKGYKPWMYKRKDGWVVNHSGLKQT